jgi:hypothetical protein
MKKESTTSNPVTPTPGLPANTPPDRTSWSLRSRRLFMTRSLDHRRSVLAEQASNAARYYEADAEREAWQGGDIVES